MNAYVSGTLTSVRSGASGGNGGSGSGSGNGADVGNSIPGGTGSDGGAIAGSTDAFPVTVTNSESVNFRLGDGEADVLSQFTGTLDAVSTALQDLVALVPNGAPPGATSTAAQGPSTLTVAVTDSAEQGALAVSRSFELGLRVGTVPQVHLGPGAPPSLAVATGGPVTVALVNWDLGASDTSSAVDCCVLFNATAPGSEDCTAGWAATATTVVCPVPPVPAELAAGAATTGWVAALRLRTSVGFYTNALQVQFAPPTPAVLVLPAPVPSPGPGTDSGTELTAVILGLTPTSASLTGGALLTVAGRGFPGSGPLVCVFVVPTTGFGGTEVTLASTASVASDGRSATCTSPAFPTPALADVFLCPSQAAYVSAADTCAHSSARLLLRVPRVVTSVWPSLGSATPGVDLTLTGTDFAASQALQCVFAAPRCPGGASECFQADLVLTPVGTAPALWLSATAAVCLRPLVPGPGLSSLFSASAPPLATLVFLGAEGEGMDVAADASTGASFLVVPVPRLTSAALTLVRSSGVGVLTVAGSGLTGAPAGTLLCHLGSASTPAENVTATTAVCVLPLGDASTLSLLQLSFNGLEKSSGVALGGGDALITPTTVVGGPEVFTPSWAFSAGVLSRAGQAAASGGQNSSLPSNSSSGVSWTVSGDGGECVAPVSPAAPGLPVSSVAAAAAAPGATNASTAAPRVGIFVGHSPGTGPTSGGTVVTFYVTGLVALELLRSDSTVLCDIVLEGATGSAPQVKVTVPATIVSPTSASCITPRGLPLGIAFMGLRSTGVRGDRGRGKGDFCGGACAKDAVGGEGDKGDSGEGW